MFDRLRRISLKVFEAETVRHYERETQPESYVKLSLEEQLLTLAGTLSDVTGNRVLLIIDELDRLRDPAGLASLIKIASSRTLKFMLVGIAQNVADLLDDHRSVERQIAPIEVPRMRPSELTAIINSALSRLEASGYSFEFHPTVVSRILGVAAGFPWFVHLLGQSSLMAAHESGRGRVIEEHFETALNGLTRNQFAQQFSDLYQLAVRDSMNRELVLRTFAMWRGRDIPTSEIYPILQQDLGVANPSVYRGHLLSAQYGDILDIPPFQEKGLVRFSNEMFKIYVRIRSSIYAGVRDSVDAAWKARRPPGEH